MHILVLYEEFLPLGPSLRRFHCINELWNSIGIGEERINQLWDIDGINYMDSRTKLGEMVKEFEGRDFRTKRIRVLELLVPCLVDDFHYEVLACRVRRFVDSTVILPGFVFSFSLVDFCSSRVPVNFVIV